MFKKRLLFFFGSIKLGNVFGTFNENTIGTNAKQNNSLVFINKLCVVFHDLAQQYKSIFFGQKNVRYFQQNMSVRVPLQLSSLGLFFFCFSKENSESWKQTKNFLLQSWLQRTLAQKFDIFWNLSTFVFVHENKRLHIFTVFAFVRKSMKT